MVVAEKTLLAEMATLPWRSAAAPTTGPLEVRGPAEETLQFVAVPVSPPIWTTVAAPPAVVLVQAFAVARVAAVVTSSVVVFLKDAAAAAAAVGVLALRLKLGSTFQHHNN